MEHATRKQSRAIPHTVTAGHTDRGKATSLFEAVSFNRFWGEYIRTRHLTEEKAMRRLRGNARHTQRHMIDHNERFDANKQPLAKRVVRLED